MHEAQMHDQNCFITLTYDQEHIPGDGSLNLKHFQDFMKRFRKKIDPKIKFFHCGEYGEKLSRPHYHACIFNYDFPDREYYSEREGVQLDTSEMLFNLWEQKGFVTVGNVTFESAAYVARYIIKKITGNKAEDHYRNVDKITGEIKKPLKTEYTTMSRRPGIGNNWFKEFETDVYPDDFVVVRGKRMRPPKYYDSMYEIKNPEKHEILKNNRIRKQLENKDGTPERLAVRETVKIAQISFLKRQIEVQK